MCDTGRFRMRFFHWFLLFFCLSANAGAKSYCATENNDVEQRGIVPLEIMVNNGENVSMECSTTLHGQTGMYLCKGNEEVLYYHPDPKSDKVTPRDGYMHRVQTKGTLTKNKITISNMTRNDTGVYTCVYLVFGRDSFTPRNVYKVMVNDEVRKAGPEEIPNEYQTKHCPNESMPSLLLIIITCVINNLMMIIIILIMLKVRRHIGVSRREHRPQVPNEYLYEEMSRKGSCDRVAAQTHVRPSPNP